ncbi:MAG: AMMECR1 domain-containing protein, partial [Planctomycetota bacterium]
MLTRMLTGLLIAACVATSGAVERPATAPGALSEADGRVLVRLARRAMGTYLDYRTPVEQQELGAAEPLTGRRAAAAVTLWDGEACRARVVADEHDSLPRNVVAAALQAMRSEHLPDRITHEVLDGLTVRVHVLGPPGPLDADAFAPARAALHGEADGRHAWLLPFEARADAMDLRAARAAVLGRLGRPARRWTVHPVRTFRG